MTNYPSKFSNSKEKKDNLSSFTKPPLLVSACLLGVNCVYDSTNNKNDQVLRLKKYFRFIPICPEQLGGLSTPRVPQSINTGTGADVLAGKTKVITRDKVDVTDNFLKGANEARHIALLTNARIAILKERSPSCGVNRIYNRHPKKDERIVHGCGVTTALLKKEGIKVFSEEELPGKLTTILKDYSIIK
jgi:uncharacterized protein YbbK (DUF523 family)